MGIPLHSSLTTIVKARVIALDVAFPAGEEICRSLWLSGAGDIALEFADGTTEIYNSVPVGRLQVQCVKVLSVGTTAAGRILAEY